MRLWFAHHLEPDDLAGFIDAGREDHEERLHLYREVERTLSAEDDRANVVRFGIAYEQAVLDWLADTAVRRAGQAAERPAT